MGVTTVEVEQFVVERQMLATENLSKLLSFIRQLLLAYLLNHTFGLCIEDAYTLPLVFIGGSLTTPFPHPPGIIWIHNTLLFPSIIMSSLLFGGFNENMESCNCKLSLIVDSLITDGVLCYTV